MSSLASRTGNVRRSAGKRIEAYLDLGAGEALLRDPRAAGMVEKALLYFELSATAFTHGW
jgi:hypothetical protein